MKRRSFVKGSIIGGAAAAIAPAVTMAQPKGGKLQEQEYYELRVYTFNNEQQQKTTEDFLKDVFIPAVKKHLNEPVGVFTELSPSGQTKLYVIIPYKSHAQADNFYAGLEIDKAYWAKGAAYLNAPASNPAFEQLDTSLLKAFKHMPLKALPAKEKRVFELRQYKSATEAAGKKKIEMFNDKGEIDIFNALVLNPYFLLKPFMGITGQT